MSEVTHDTREECINNEAWLGPDAPGDTHGDLEAGGDRCVCQPVECPVCGREYEYVYDLVGLFDPKEGDYPVRF